MNRRSDEVAIRWCRSLLPFKFGADGASSRVVIADALVAEIKK